MFFKRQAIHAGLWIFLAVGPGLAAQATGNQPGVNPPQLVLSFGQEPPGSPPAALEDVSGKDKNAALWQVTLAQKAVPGRQVLIQAAKRPVSAPPAIALLKDLQIAEGELSVKIRVIEDKARTSGLVWRYQNPDDYWALVINHENDRMEIHRVKRGREKVITSREIIFVPHTWYTLSLTFAKKDFLASLNGEAVLSGREAARPGRVGITTRGAAKVQFDDFSVSGLPAPKSAGSSEALE